MAWEVPMSDSVRSLTLYGVKRGKARGRTHSVSPVDSTWLGLEMLLRGGSPGGMVGVEMVEGFENIPSKGFRILNFW